MEALIEETVAKTVFNEQRDIDWWMIPWVYSDHVVRARDGRVASGPLRRYIDGVAQQQAAWTMNCFLRCLWLFTEEVKRYIVDVQICTIYRHAGGTDINDVQTFKICNPPIVRCLMDEFL
jgi:hypothetical protein